MKRKEKNFMVAKVTKTISNYIINFQNESVV